jgi:hypothetical protein
VRCKSESPCSRLLNSVLAERAAQENRTHKANESDSMALACDQDTFRVVFADSEWNLRWLWLPWGAPIGLTPSGLGSLKAVTVRVGSRVRNNLLRMAVTHYP